MSRSESQSSIPNTLSVPKGYKQTEVGVIPDDWFAVCLNSVCDRISVGLATSVTQHYRRSGVPIVRNLNIKNGYFDGSDMLYVSEEFAGANATKAAKGHDVLTVRTGSNLGLTCVLPAEFDGCQTFTTLITTPNKAWLDPYYLSSQMSSLLGKAEMGRLEVGGGKGNLNTGHLKNYRLAFPPLPEQRAIATALSDVDALLGALDRLIAKKRDLKQAAMQQLLTGQTRLPGFKGEWRQVTLGDVITECFSGATPRRDRPEYFKGKIRWITSGELNYNVITDTLEKITPQAVKNTNLSVVPKGTFLMAITGLEAEGTRGSCGIVGEPSTTNQSCMAVFPTAELVTEYLFHYYVLRGKTLALQFCQGTKQQSYTAKLVKLLPIDLPPTPKEQTAIAEVLSDMDAEIVALEQRREKIRALKQGMMQELLTGGTRLI